MSKDDQVSRGQAIQHGRLAARIHRLPFIVASATLGFLVGGWLGAVTAPVAQKVPAHVYVNAKLYELKHPFVRLQRSPEAIEAVRSIDFHTRPGGMSSTAVDAIVSRATKTGSAGAMVFGSAVFWVRRRRWIAVAKEEERDRLKRGGHVVQGHQLTKIIPANAKEVRISIAGIAIPNREEGRHTLIVGRTGCGKSTLLRSACYQIAARGDHAIVYDPDGSFVARFYKADRGDIILNPFDERSARWNPFDDVKSSADADRLASFIVPKPANANEGSIWYDHARALVAAVIDKLRRQGRATIEDLDLVLRSATVEELRALVAGTAAARSFEPNAEKATASVLFTMGEASKMVSLLADIPACGQDFSFDRFYASLQTPGSVKAWIFIAAPKRAFAASRPILAAWLDCAASAILERSTNTPPRAWFVVDELPSLPRVSSLLVLLPEGRKYGAGAIIAFQSISQLRETYGTHGASIIVGQTATQVIMQAGDPETAKWGQDLFGSAEIEVRRASASLDSGKLVNTGSLSAQRETKPLVLDSEIMGLPMGSAFLRLSGYPVARVKVGVEYESRPEIADGFVARPEAPPSSMTVPVQPNRRLEDQVDWLTRGGVI